VFISYSHADAKWLAKIRTMLTPLVRADRIAVWDDTRIKAGAKWKPEIDKAIASARVALLLVSPAFLASPFIADEELPPILEAAEKEGLVIVWALLSACLYKKTAVGAYQAAHPIAKPLDSLPVPKRNQALLAIAETVGAAFDNTNRGA
jgi:internalin A